MAPDDARTTTTSARAAADQLAAALLHTRLQRCVPGPGNSLQVLQAKHRAALCIAKAYQDQLAKSVRWQLEQRQQQHVQPSRDDDAPPQQQHQSDVIHATDNTDDGPPDACDAPKPAASPAAQQQQHQQEHQQQQEEEQQAQSSSSPLAGAQDVVEDSQPCEHWPSQQHQQQQQQPSLRVLHNLLGAGSSAHELGSSSSGDRQLQPPQVQQQVQPQEEPQPPWPGPLQPLRHKQALERLLGGSLHPAAPTAAGAASIPLPQQQQQPPPTDAPVYLGRQRRLPRASQPGGVGPAAAQHPHSMSHSMWQQQQQIGLCEDSPGAQQQRQMLQVRGCHLFDAQSQAPPADGDAHDTAAAAAAAGGGGGSGGGWPVRRPGAAAQQQLFSPHTATHEPPLAGSSSGGGSSSRARRASTGTRLQQASGAAQPPLQPSAVTAAAAGGPQAQHRQQHWLEQQSDEIEVTPSQQQPGRGGYHAAALAAVAPVAATAQRCHPALHPWGSGAPTTAAAAATTAARAAAPSFAAGAASAQQQQHGQLGGAAAGAVAVAATPATALPCRRADAADLATALFHTPGAPSAAAHVAGAPGPPVADSRVAATPESVAAPPPAASAGAQLQGSGARAAPMVAAAPASGLGGCSAIEETLPPSQEGFALQAAQQPEVQGGEAQQLGAAGAVAATPPPAAFGGQLPQEWASAAGGAALAAAAAVSQIPATPLSELQQQQGSGAAVPGSARLLGSLSQQELAGDAAAAAVGPIRCLLGSFMPESPIAQQGGSGNAAEGAEGADCAAAGAAAARALEEAALGAAEIAAASGSPADSSHAALVVPPPAAEVQPCTAQMLPPPARPWQQQQQQTCQAGPAAAHGLMLPPPPLLSAATAGAASAQLCTGRGSVVHVGRRRLQRLQLGLPIVQLLCCQGGALVVCQDPHDPRRRLLQQLAVQGSGHQGGEQQGVVAELVRGAAVSAPALSAAAAAAGMLDRGQELLQSGLLLLPPQPDGSGSSSTAGQLLAAVLPLQVQGLSNSSSWAPAAAVPEAHSRSGSSAKRKRLAEGASAACDSSSHGVSIYQLATPQQHGCPDVSGSNAADTAVHLVQRLSTPRAVCCMAASAEAGLLAAGGTGGWAYVWPLRPAAPEQQLAGAVATTPAGADADAAPGAWRSKAAGGMQQQQPHQQAAAAVVVDAGGLIELQQAVYRGIAFAEISELCFVLQPGATPLRQWASVLRPVPLAAGKQEQRRQTASLLGPSSPVAAGPRSSSSCDARVLLVGCSSLGSVVVWDVAARSALFTVHSPEVRLSGLMALPSAAAPHAAAAVREAVRGMRVSAARQSGQRDEAQPPVLLLARVCVCSSEVQQQQQQALRPVLLRNDTSCGLQLGVPLMSDASAVAAAALCSTTAVAAAAAGSAAQAWDVVTGEVRMRIRHSAAPAEATAPAGATVAAGAVQTTPRAGSNGTAGADTLVLLGSTSGVLRLALL